VSYKDTNYIWLAGGSTATSAATAHNIFGTYNGLSSLNANEVVILMVSACAGDLRVSLNPAGGATNDTSLRIFQAASTFDIPPMTVANASQITMARETGSNNPVLFWAAMIRVP
jgi:hypothetical protein